MSSINAKIHTEDKTPELPDVIRDAVSKNKLVVFIGAGVSALVGCKRWPDLAKHLAEECFKKDCINYSEMEQLKNDSDHLKVISVAYGINCLGCMEYHKSKGIEVGLTEEQMQAAVQIAEQVKTGAANKTKGFAKILFGEISEGSCCAGGSECCC